MRRERRKNAIIITTSILFVLLLGVYFLYRNVHEWIPDIIPEFLGVILLGFFITIALKKRMSFIKYVIIIGSVVVLCILGYIYGLRNDVGFLVDLLPELLGATGLSLVLSLIFKKKIWQ